MYFHALVSHYWYTTMLKLGPTSLVQTGNIFFQPYSHVNTGMSVYRLENTLLSDYWLIHQLDLVQRQMTPTPFSAPTYPLTRGLVAPDDCPLRWSGKVDNRHLRRLTREGWLKMNGGRHE